LALMFVAIYFKRSLHTVLSVGILSTAVLLGDLSAIPRILIRTATDYTTLSLVLMIYLVFLLNNILNSAGALKRVMDSIEGLMGDARITMSAIPMLIGAVPSPSGAVLSAPFVDLIGEKSNASRERRLLINYWFRHVSEYINPIYPGVLLAVSLSGIEFKDLLYFNFPVMLAYLSLGAFFFHTSGKKPQKKNKTGGLWIIFVGILPILVAIIVPVLFSVELYVALSAAVAISLLLHMQAIPSLYDVAKKSMKPDLIFVIFLVMLFNFVLEEYDVADGIRSSLSEKNIKPYVVLVIVPMLLGFLTGLTIGYVGLSFPMLLPLMTSENASIYLPYVTLAFVSGYLGVLISPMHLCLSVTQKYYGACWIKTYQKLIPAVLSVFVFTVFYVASFSLL
jgi:uncharacterized protein